SKSLRCPDGERFFASMMNRAPGRAIAERRLRGVGGGSRVAPASLALTSPCLRRTISARTPSAMGSLGIGVEHPSGLAGKQRLAREFGTIAKVRCLAGDEQ